MSPLKIGLSIFFSEALPGVCDKTMKGEGNEP